MKPSKSEDKSIYLSWQQIKELHEMGFEIANHTKNHAVVTKISEAEFIEQLKYIEDKCEELRITKPENFAYPVYAVNYEAVEILKKRGYKFARTGSDRPYDPEKDHPLLIPSWTSRPENKEEIMEAIKMAEGGQIIVLTLHGVPDIEHPHVNTPPELFEEYLQYLSKNNYTVISMKDLNNYIIVEYALDNIKPEITLKQK